MFIALILLAALEVIPLSGQNKDLKDRVKHGYANNQGVKIHYVTLGNGPLVVMVHGFPDFWYTWRHQIESLAGEYQVVAIDLRGYNESDKPQGVEHYAMRNLIGDVVSVIKSFPQQKAVLIGHDWGGAISWQVAMWRPDVVEKLIILSTPHPNGLIRELTSNDQQKENAQYAADYQKEGAAQELTAEGLAEWVKDDEARPAYIEAFHKSDFEAMLNYYKASFPNKKNSTSATPASPPLPPKKVLCPTLGIFGMQDKALLPAGWNGTWEWIDNEFTLLSIPQAGHFVHHDARDIVTKKIVEWIHQ